MASMTIHLDHNGRAVPAAIAVSSISDLWPGLTRCTGELLRSWWKLLWMMVMDMGSVGTVTDN